MIKVKEVKNHKITIPRFNPKDCNVLNVLVAEGKFVLVECKKEESLISKYWDNEGKEHVFITSTIDKQLLSSHKHYKPIIISETEKIEVGDWIYSSYHKQIYKVTRIDGISITVYEKDKYSGTFSLTDRDIYKVLALPEHFSHQQLQYIVDGKLKEGKVLVECEEYVHCMCGRTTHTAYSECDEEKCVGKIRKHIKLNSQSHITLYEVEEDVALFTQDQVIALLQLLEDDRGWRRKDYIKDWFKEHVKKVL